MTSLFHTLNISKVDMLNRLLDLDVVSNNLANVNTVGYKSNRANFQELLAANGMKDGIQFASTQALMHQGSFQMTGSSLDWAIEGEGLFAVQLPDGRTAYTRDGHFQLDAENNLVSSSGYPLIWQGTLPPDTQNVSVGPNGQVSALTETGWQEVGTVQLSRFANPTALSSFGQNVFLATDVSGAAQANVPGQNGYGIIRAQALEQSNVDMAQEMTHLMTLQRSFQISTRLFQQTDSMINLAINMRKY